MEFVSYSYGKEFYQSTLKHVTCKTMYTRLSGGNVDSSMKHIAM